ncbi:MAG TPA: hypothetical protein DCE58_06575 [Cryomorphaceae bacterium]|nr:hypothetical protein [Cryomorphaceae bacterium]
MLTTLRFSMMFALVNLSWLIMEYLVGLQTVHIDQFLVYDNLFFIPAVAIMVWALRYRRAEMGSAWNYWEGLKLGGIMGVLVGLLSVPSLYFFFTYINPGFFEDFIAFSVGSGEATPDEAAAYFNFKSYATQSALFAPVAGLVTNAIAGIFYRKPIA